MMEQVFQVELPEWEPKETPQEGREKALFAKLTILALI